MEQAAPAQTTLGIALFENRVRTIFPLGPAALAGTLQTGDTGLFVNVAAPKVDIRIKVCMMTSAAALTALIAFIGNRYPMKHLT
jgi:hypothetical protein